MMRKASFFKLFIVAIAGAWAPATSFAEQSLPSWAVATRRPPAEAFQPIESLDSIYAKYVMKSNNYHRRGGSVQESKRSGYLTVAMAGPDASIHLEMDLPVPGSDGATTRLNQRLFLHELAVYAYVLGEQCYMDPFDTVAIPPFTPVFRTPLGLEWKKDAEAKLLLLEPRGSESAKVLSRTVVPLAGIELEGELLRVRETALPKGGTSTVCSLWHSPFPGAPKMEMASWTVVVTPDGTELKVPNTLCQIERWEGMLPAQIQQWRFDHGAFFPNGYEGVTQEQIDRLTSERASSVLFDHTWLRMIESRPAAETDPISLEAFENQITTVFPEGRTDEGSAQRTIAQNPSTFEVRRIMDFLPAERRWVPTTP